MCKDDDDDDPKTDLGPDGCSGIDIKLINAPKKTFQVVNPQKFELSCSVLLYTTAKHQPYCNENKYHCYAKYEEEI